MSKAYRVSIKRKDKRVHAPETGRIEADGYIVIYRQEEEKQAGIVAQGVVSLGDAIELIARMTVDKQGMEEGMKLFMKVLWDMASADAMKQAEKLGPEAVDKATEMLARMKPEME